LQLKEQQRIQRPKVRRRALLSFLSPNLLTNSLWQPSLSIDRRPFPPLTAMA
jgi:hypothetical protein